MNHGPCPGGPPFVRWMGLGGSRPVPRLRRALPPWLAAHNPVWEGWRSLHQVLPGFPKTLPLGKGAVMYSMETLKTL